jgi:hypothetical protein
MWAPALDLAGGISGLERGCRLGGGRDLDLCRVRRRGRAARPARAPRRRAGVLERLDAKPPTIVAILEPDHVRDVDLFVGRYGARAFGPWLFWRTNIPESELEGIEPGSALPGGLVALSDGRGRNETPVWLPEQRTLVFADALTAPGGELRVWSTR